MYSIYREQTLPIKLQEAWDFFSSPSNLSKITPDNLGFKILGNAPEKMYPGLFIHYRVSPLLGIPMKWTTEITQVEYQKYFVDEQRVGPYAIWHHEHFFEETKDGVLMKDHIHYKLPLGLLGRLVHPLIVKPRLNEIFNFRFEVAEKLFSIKEK
jgi:ligand-binding SRPBCC domain-containing protein|tara:strand:- start:691 stop:1152 length:462 start_codon:yes stop_codon:yes gene_type:complete